ncbi:sensor histidine kinase [uncultured Croceitalea sp.]|uniref:sensor histidine kinase n=1 Tax=uncultured Croceitalea sp. TaxID=1798908 RepID=UPI0033068FF0
MRIDERRFLEHLLFWLAVYVFYIFSSASHELFGQSVETTFYRLPLFMAAAYSFNYWQIPRYFKQKKYLAFVVSMLFVVISLVVVYRVIGYYRLDEFCVDGPYPLISLEDFPFYMLSFHFPALVMYFYKNNKEQAIERRKIYELEKEKVATELKYLKAQLNPHFLFNTLNNLYSYVITNSPKAPEMVLQLSEILDYILYKSQNTFVPLAEEIQTIQNYIALERIKYENRLKVRFNSDYKNKQLLITPLLLLSLVENAFKHGVHGSISKPEVRILLEETNEGIRFSVWNTKINDPRNKTDNDKKRIGLANIERQLDLIYPKNYQLKKEDTDTTFNLELTLILT